MPTSRYFFSSNVVHNGYEKVNTSMSVYNWITHGQDLMLKDIKTKVKQLTSHVFTPLNIEISAVESQALCCQFKRTLDSFRRWMVRGGGSELVYTVSK